MTNVPYVMTNMNNVPRSVKYSAQIFAIKFNCNAFAQNGVDIASYLTEDAEQSVNIQENSIMIISHH